MLRMTMLAAAAAGTLLASASATEALDRRVRVINNTSEVMMKFQASNRDRRTWEEDILGRDVLRPGQSVVININDGSGYCVFDFRATFRSGATATRRQVNVCRVASWTIND
jgi:hypothetical protein